MTNAVALAVDYVRRARLRVRAVEALITAADFADAVRESQERPTLPGWELPIAPHLTHGSEPARYLHDVGDDWNHFLICEDMLPADGGHVALKIRR